MGLGAPRCCPRMSVCCEASVLRADCHPMSPLSPCAVRRHAMGAAAHLGPHPALSLAGPTETQSSHSQPHSAANCGSWAALATKPLSALCSAPWPAKALSPMGSPSSSSAQPSFFDFGPAHTTPHVPCIPPFPNTSRHCACSPEANRALGCTRSEYPCYGGRLRAAWTQPWLGSTGWPQCGTVKDVDTAPRTLMAMATMVPLSNERGC